jgi:2-keto-4-pentenoate hydratase
MPAFDPTPSAELLAAALCDGTQIAELPSAGRPADLAQAYDVQDRVAAISKDRAAGWKLGLGSANAMRGANLKRPVIGRMFASRLKRNGETVRLPSSYPILVEIEIAVVLSRDIAPTDKVAPRDAFATAHIVSELVQSRFVDRKVVGLPSFVADSVGFAALVVGHPIDIDRLPEIVEGVVVSLDGKEASRAAKGDDAINPLEMLDHLMAHARERGITLRKDDVVTTGTLTRPFDIVATNGTVSVRAPGVELDFKTVM